MRISRTTSESLMGIWNVEKDVFECRKVCVVVMEVISLLSCPGIKYDFSSLLQNWSAKCLKTSCSSGGRTCL